MAHDHDHHMHHHMEMTTIVPPVVVDHSAHIHDQVAATMDHSAHGYGGDHSAMGHAMSHMMAVSHNLIKSKIR